MKKLPQVAFLLFNAIEKNHSLEASYNDKVFELDSLLTKLFVDISKEANVQFSMMFTRIAYICHEYDISPALQWRIHQLRKKKKAAFSGAIQLSEAEYFSSFKTAAFAVSALCQTPVSDSLRALLPEAEEEVEPWKIVVDSKIPYLRVMVIKVLEDKEFLICKSYNDPSQTIYVKFNTTGYNENYNATIQHIKKDFNGHVSLNLIDITVNDKGVYYPKAIVIEPDYMVDVSAIAKCFHGTVALAENYLLDKFMPFTYTTALMLGNVANFFLDELMTNPNATFVDTFPKAFALNPLAFATFSDAEVLEIYHKSQKHFTNLKTVIHSTLEKNNIIPKDCYLEPSFYSEKYGIQGRLDIWHKNPASDKAAIVELKSGSPFYPNRFGLSHPHYVQTLLYDLLVRSVYGEAVDPWMYVLYSGVDVNHLKYAPPLKFQQDEAIKLRNDIIALEKNLADLDLFPLDSNNILDRLSGESFAKASKFTQQDAQLFAQTLIEASLLERFYFMSFASFTAREHLLAKIGIPGKDVNGLAALWLNDYEDKNESFEVLGFLQIIENKAGEEHPILRFKRTDRTNELANFRQGDIVVLYPYIHEGDNALRNQIFKGSIASIDKHQVALQLHSRQFNSSLFEQKNHWHIEKDMMESSFRVQYGALFSFLQAKQHHKNLLLTIKAPEEATVKKLKLSNPNLSTEQRNVLHKAIAAKDYFLLVGPPGTGKTKFMLAEMVRYLLVNTQEQILLMAYTNRAVDEICEAIEEFADKDYVRIGSEHSTDERFRKHLFSVQTADFKRRADLVAFIEKHRIFVSTVASIAGKENLLQLKKFDTAIIDEASQILEPMLVGMLPHFGRFVLIGDHKQLPAVVLQDKDRSEVKEENLRAIGLKNRRNSLFERLHQRAQAEGWTWAYDMLSHQGRMHDDICRFPSHFFYNDALKLLPEDSTEGVWQKEKLDYQLPENCTELQKSLATKRLLFFDCNTNPSLKNPKTNPYEAEKVGEIMEAFDTVFKANNLVLNPKNIGIITPFRAQIAQIRHTLSEYEKGFENCTIDTVERYQGGARDIIIISLCLNNPFQLESIVSLSDDEKVDRKLNVALTRARKHLIVLGNAELMKGDKRYAELIEFCDVKM